MAVGYVDGHEVWADGCCIKDKVLAERIALNMQVSFEAGVRWATTRAAAQLACLKPPSTNPVCYQITINGAVHEWKHRSITLEDINRLLGRDISYVIYSTTYARGHEPKPSGLLNQSECVPVREGMIFNSYDTSNA